MHACMLSQLFVIPLTAAHQAPLSMRFSRPRILEWGAISFSGDLSNPGIELWSPALQAGSLPTKLQGKPKFIRGEKDDKEY